MPQFNLQTRLEAMGYTPEQVATIRAAEQRLRPGAVPQDAIEYFRAKKLEPAFDYDEVWKEEHNYAFTVAKVMERDILADVQQSILQAIEQGETFEQWRKNIENTLDKSGWSAYGEGRPRPHRLWIIYRTNSRVARATGQWQRVQRTKRTHPYLQYLLGPSVVHRAEHELIDGLIAAVDDPIWDEIMPPNGYGCNCHVRQLSESEAESLGGETDQESLDVDLNDVPDDGWDYNPGKERADFMKSLEDQL